MKKELPMSRETIEKFYKAVGERASSTYRHYYDLAEKSEGEQTCNLIFLLLADCTESLTRVMALKTSGFISKDIEKTTDELLDLLREGILENVKFLKGEVSESTKNK